MTTDSTKLFMCPDMESIVLAYKKMKGKKNINLYTYTVSQKTGHAYYVS